MSAREIPYQKFNDAPAKKLFLDTNVVMSLTDRELAVRGRPGIKNPRLAGLLNTARQQSARLVTSPLVLEELFHLVTRRAMADACKQRGRSNEKELRRDFPDDHLAARKRGTGYLKLSIASLGGHSVAVEAPSPQDQDAKAWGKQMLGDFQRLIEACAFLGAMDAMHIIWGHALGCDAFVSVDSDIRSVPGITVFVP